VDSEKILGKKGKRRNYKRHNSLFVREKTTPAWVGAVVGDDGGDGGAVGGDPCPAYLISGNHVVTSSVCVSSHSLTVIFSQYRVTVTRVTLHPVLHIALLTLHTELPYNTLCHPEEFIQTLIPSESDARHHSSHQIRGWLEQAVVGEEVGL